MDTKLHQDIAGCHGIAVMTKHATYDGVKHWYFINKSVAEKLFHNSEMQSHSFKGIILTIYL